jgi:hypothetical protein
MLMLLIAARASCGRWIFPITRKGDNPTGLYNKILAAKESKGSCVLYQSMAKVLAPKQLGSYITDPKKSCWLIVLTDLVDLSDRSKSHDSVSDLIKTMCAATDFNLAIIDSQTISGYEPNNERWPEWRNNVKRMVDDVAASGNGNKTYHIAAHSASEITDAFARVASLMNSQASEQL